MRILYLLLLLIHENIIINKINFILQNKFCMKNNYNYVLKIYFVLKNIKFVLRKSVLYYTT